MKRSRQLLFLGIGIILLALFVNRVHRERFKILANDLEDIDKLKTEITKQLPDSAEMSAPEEDELFQIMYFKDSEGVERVLIPYKKSSSNKPLNLMVLERSGNYWVEEEKIPLVGEDFDKIVVEDITGNGADEIIVGIKIGKSSTKGLDVYEFKDGSLVKLLNDNYEDLFVADFDSDSIGELILLKSNSKEKNTEINYYEYRDGKLATIDSIVLEEMEFKVDLKLEQINRDKKGLIAELETEDKKGVLSVFKVEGDNLERLSLLGKKSIENPFFVAARDIDKDGVFEFPILKLSPGLEKEDSSTWITEWYGLNEDYSQLKLVKREYTDEANFALDFFDSWNEDIAISRISDRDGKLEKVEFKRNSSGGTEDNLFSIAIYSLDSWEDMSKESRESEEIITKSQGRVYVLESSGDEYSLENIKSRFRVLDLIED